MPIAPLRVFDNPQLVDGGAFAGDQNLIELAAPIDPDAEQIEVNGDDIGVNELLPIEQQRRADLARAIHRAALYMPASAWGVEFAREAKDVTIQKKDATELKISQMFRLPAPEQQTHEYLKEFMSYHPHLLPKTPYVWRDPGVLVGVEVEIENLLHIDANIPLCFWRITEDGSLRNNGREFKTVALPLRYLEPALNQLFNGINPDIDFSKRTSIHFHFDVRHLTSEQVTSFVLLYAAVENVLFRYVKGERRNNIFCVPITESNLLQRNTVNVEHFIRHIDQYWYKYTALNLLPVKTLGTMEFRQMPGTSDVHRLLIWADLLSRLRLFAYKHPLTHIWGMITQLNTTSEYKKFLETVFEELIVYLDSTNLHEVMDKPVYLIKNCTVGNQYHQYLSLLPVSPNSYFASLFKSSSIATFTPVQKAGFDILNQELAEMLGIIDAEQMFQWCHTHMDDLLNDPTYSQAANALFHDLPIPKLRVRPH